MSLPEINVERMVISVILTIPMPLSMSPPIYTFNSAWNEWGDDRRYAWRRREFLWTTILYNFYGPLRTDQALRFYNYISVFHG